MVANVITPTVGDGRSTEEKRDILSKTKSVRKLNTGIIVALIGFVGTIIAILSSSPVVEKWMRISPTITEPAIATNMLEPSQTPTKDILPAATPVMFDPHPDASDYFDTFGVPMRFVPAGEFTRGTNKSTPAGNHKPVHLVYLNDFYIDKYEVTNFLYKLCVDDGFCRPPSDKSSETREDYFGNPKYANDPVTNADWYMARIFASGEMHGCLVRLNGKKLLGEQMKEPILGVNK